MRLLENSMTMRYRIRRKSREARLMVEPVVNNPRGPAIVTDLRSVSRRYGMHTLCISHARSYSHSQSHTL